MREIFIEVLNLSITSCWLILAVLCLRMAIRQVAPRWTACLLWGLVAVCLIVPFTFESALSLVPSRNMVIYETEDTEKGDTVTNDSAVTEKPSAGQNQQSSGLHINSGFATLDDRINAILDSLPKQEVTDTETNTPVTTDKSGTFLDYASYVWVVGLIITLGYFMISLLMLKLKLKGAIHYKDRVYFSEKVDSPFVFGFIRPRVYLPMEISEETEEYVLAHEYAHIKRLDHITKPIGFTLLAIHWFNPLVWLAYSLLCRDIEYACDEKVIRDMGGEERKAYATALLECGVKATGVVTCPVAFGEISVKSRIIKALNYKKPTLWIILSIVAATALLAVCFLSSPKTTINEINLDKDENGENVIDKVVLGTWYADGHSLMFEDGGDGICYADGALIPFTWTTDKDSLNLTLSEGHKGAVDLPTNTAFTLSDDKTVLTIGDTVYTSTYQSKATESIDSALVGDWYNYSAIGENSFIFKADGTGETEGATYKWSVKDGVLSVTLDVTDSQNLSLKFKSYTIDGDTLKLNYMGLTETYSKTKVSLGGGNVFSGTWNTKGEEHTLELSSDGTGTFGADDILWALDGDNGMSIYKGFDTVTGDKLAEYETKYSITLDGDSLVMSNDTESYSFTKVEGSGEQEAFSDPDHELGGDIAVAGDWVMPVDTDELDLGLDLNIHLNEDGTGSFDLSFVTVELRWYTEDFEETDLKRIVIYSVPNDYTVNDLILGTYEVKGDAMYVNLGDGIVCLERKDGEATGYELYLEPAKFPFNEYSGDEYITFEDGNAWSDTLVFSADANLTNFRFIEVDVDWENDFALSAGKTLYTIDTLTTDKQFVVGTSIGEGMSFRGIAFTDPNGNEFAYRINYIQPVDDTDPPTHYSLEKITINN